MYLIYLPSLQGEGKGRTYPLIDFLAFNSKTSHERQPKYKKRDLYTWHIVEVGLLSGSVNGSGSHLHSIWVDGRTLSIMLYIPMYMHCTVLT